MDHVKFEDTTTCNSCGSLHTSATVFINSVVHHQVQRVRNHYFSSDAWETIILIPTSEKPLLSYEINWLVSEYLSLLSTWFHVRGIRHLLIGRKNHATIMWPQNNRNAMNRFLGKTPWCITLSTSSFSENVTQCKRTKFNLFFDFLFF